MFFAMLSMIENEQERRNIADIYAKNQHKLFHAAKLITCNRQSAEDAVQESFIEIIKQKEKIFSLECNLLYSYIVTIVRNKAIDILRRQKKTANIDISEAEQFLQSDELPVDEQVIGKLGFERIAELTEGLCENYRDILEMKYTLSLSIQEIAEILNIKEGNAKVRLHRAKESLKKLIESEVELNV